MISRVVAFFLLLILHFSCSSDNATLKVKGSDTEVNLAVRLAESFHDVNPEDFVSISGGGSGLGIASLLNGTADIANSSRSINRDELELFKKRELAIDSFVFALDAIAFVVADDAGIDSINVSTLAALMSGKISTWSSVNGKQVPVTIYGRQSNSGTHDYVKHKLNIVYSPNANQMNGNAQILEAIKADHSGIGYVGAGYVMKGRNPGIKVLKVYTDKHGQATSPLDPATIAAGNYFFQRPLFQYYKKESFKKIRPFLEFEKGREGQRIIRESGYYPVNKKTSV